MDNKIVYDKFDWSKINYDFIKGKVHEINQAIPSDVKSIIDVGCGNGVITNMLGQKYDVTAIDRSEQALKFVETKKIKASSNNIPLENESFDMIFSSELLEHLPGEIFKGTISEFKRLSKKYIFITVPNEENPDKLSIVCPECGYLYNSPNHLRYFDINKLIALFPEYKLLKTFTFGKKVRYYNRNILKLKTNLTPSRSWLPYYWIPKKPYWFLHYSEKYNFIHLMNTS